MMNIRRVYLLLFILLFLAPGMVAQEGVEHGLEMRMNSKSVLTALEPIREKLQQWSVAFFFKNKLMHFGMVVSPDGMIVTKASELDMQRDYQIRVGEERYDSFELIGMDEASDLAVIKIAASGLEVPSFDGRHPSLGMMVVSNGASTRFARRPRLGVISSFERSMPYSQRQKEDVKYTGFTVELKFYMHLDMEAFTSSGIFGIADSWMWKYYLEIRLVEKGSPADKAGIKPDDGIIALNGRMIKSLDDMRLFFRKKKIGDLVLVTVKRGENVHILKMRIGSLREYKGEDALPKSKNEFLSGYTSKRRNGFDLVLAHDTPLPANYMGGPLIDLKGNVRGLNIARYNRIETFALPIEKVLEICEQLMKEYEAKK